MAAADKWIVFDNWMLKAPSADVDITTDVFKVALFLSTLGTPNTDTGTGYTNTSEVATAFGYTQGGQTEVASWLESATGVYDFSMINPVWNASGGAITARYAIIYDDTAPGKPMVAWSLLDSLPQDVSAPDGQTFTVDIETNGVYTETRAV